MQDKSDVQLLREYAEQGNEAAFRELVLRHTDLIYSAALRQVVSPDLAGDVAQSVFTDLARKAWPLAEKLTEDASLVGWLYRSTRFAALNQLRGDRRRLAHERQAMGQPITTEEPGPDWDRLRPVLDEAMAGLSDKDRDALLLRFFKQHDFRTVGLALGVSDDVAQKRVSRALEKLRTQFTRRGVTITSAAIAAALVSHSTQAAPAGLAAAISSAAVLARTTITATATATITKAIAMTTTHKVLIAAATAGLAVTAGTSLYQTHRGSQLQRQLVALQQQQEPLLQQVEQLCRERDDVQKQITQLRRENAELPRLRGEVTRLQANARELAQLKAGDGEKSTGADTQKEADPTESEMKSWLARVNQLKQRLEQMPEAKIPEFQFLTEQDWLNAAKGKLETDEDYRGAFASLRGAGECKFSPMVQQALRQYLQANNGQFPTDLFQLQPYFKSPVDEAILQRYAIVPAQSLPNTKMGGDWVITQKARVDEEYDSIVGIGPNGYGVSGPHILAPALKAFAAANNGQEPADPSQLLPYVTTPAQQAAVQKWIQSSGTNITQQGSISTGQ